MCQEPTPEFEVRYNPCTFNITMSTSQNFSTKLPPPSELPEQGLTAVQWKPWKNQMLTFLQQFPRNIVFLPAPPRPAGQNPMQEGIYESWLPSAQHGLFGRIQELHASDKATERTARAREIGKDREVYTGARVDAHGVRVAAAWKADAESVEIKVKILEELDHQTLIDRNRDLSLLLAHITNCIHVNESDDVTNRSTSLNWIWNYLQRHYNIAPKGANFLRIASISYKSGDNHYAFYKRFRASFIDNLRKAGDKDDARWSDARLAADERLSPSQEDTICLWALEKIDPRLPEKVRRDYEHYLTEDCYLSDLHPRIFQRVPMMLEEMDQAAHIASMSVQLSNLSVQGAVAQLSTGDVNLQAFNFGGGRARGTRRPFSTPGGRGRGGAAGGRGGGSLSARGGGQAGRIWHTIYCGKCKGEGKPEAIFTAHNTVNCPSLASISMEDRSEMIQALLASLTTESNYNPDNFNQTDDDFQQEGDLFHQPRGQEPSS